MKMHEYYKEFFDTFEKEIKQNIYIEKSVCVCVCVLVCVGVCVVVCEVCLFNEIDNER